MSFSTRCLFLVSNCRFCFSQGFLNLISNSSCLNKGNHDDDDVWIPDLNKHRFSRFYFSVFSLVSVFIKSIYQTLMAALNHISKHLKVCQKYSAVIFSTLLPVFGNVVKHGLLCLINYLPPPYHQFQMQ